MNRRNYQKELEVIIKQNEDRSRVPRLFLHSCCAPCSSYVLEYLSKYFEITVFYYNPNISPKEEYAKRAAKGGFDYFTTTLTISPLKNADCLNQIGEILGTLYPVKYLPSDFKKKNGYKRSVELSEEYGLYRQDYCGCVFSKRIKTL